MRATEARRRPCTSSVFIDTSSPLSPPSFCLSAWRPSWSLSRASFGTTASALILVAVIVTVAALNNRFSGFVATLSATLWFDYFLTQQYERLAITHRPDIETAVCLFVVGIIVTGLAARSCHYHASAAVESDYVALIYEVSELVASGSPAWEVIEPVRRALVDVLHLRARRYEDGPSLRPAMRLDNDAQVVLGGRLWSVDRMGLPGPEIELLVEHRRKTLGRLSSRPLPATKCRSSLVAVALADQVVASLRPQLRSAKTKSVRPRRAARAGGLLRSWRATRQ